MLRVLESLRWRRALTRYLDSAANTFAAVAIAQLLSQSPALGVDVDVAALAPFHFAGAVVWALFFFAVHFFTPISANALSV